MHRALLCFTPELRGALFLHLELSLHHLRQCVRRSEGHTRIPAPGGVKASSCGHSTTTAVSGKAARASSTPAHICSLVSARSTTNASAAFLRRNRQFVRRSDK